MAQHKDTLSFLCVCTYFKGLDFLRQCKELGNAVYLITDKKLENKPWPWESIDETFYLDGNENTPKNLESLANGVAFLMRSRKIDCIVALDDFDVEKGAFLRETFRVDGMGQTTARYFRDKLAMRMKAQSSGINIPVFSSLFHDESNTEYLQNTQAPWVIKPRSEASATGITKVHNLDEAWQVIHDLGDRRHDFLIEQFKPGDVYHVDSLTVDNKIVFQRCSQYLNTPMEVAHGGGVFRSVVVEFDSKDEKALRKINEQVLKAFGLKNCASHSEFIKCKEDGKFYFLETSARVGGANLVEMVQASSGINLWREWAKLETAILKGEEYKVPDTQKDYAGIIISLCRYQHPEYTPFQDSEIVWKMQDEYHVGLIVKAQQRERILKILDAYVEIIFRDYHASAPIINRQANG